MKLLYILMYFFCVFNTQSEKYIDIGTWQKTIDVNNSIYIELSYVKKTNNITKQQLSGKYKYEVYGISKSKHNNKIVNTWLYNTNIFIDWENVIKNQYLDGFTIILKNKPTLIYFYRTNKEHPEFKITWKKISIEN